MFLPVLFWFALLFPGFALVRRIAAEELRSGLLGSVAVVYLASLAALSPISMACYLLRLPITAFALACLVFVIWGILDLSRQRAWREIARMLGAAAGVELVIVLADAALGGWNGAFLGGDARVHVARIRFLLDNGFSNIDPFIREPHFFPVYHTNLLHALFAACARLTGVDVFGVWFVGLAWAKLVVASAAYYLAWRVFGHTLPAWAAALFCIGARGPIHYALYPNQLAPYWVIPVMMGLAVRGWSGGFDRSCIILLAAGAIVLGQLHGLYAVLAVGLIGPVLLVRAAGSRSIRRDDRIAALRAFAVLLVGLPFVAVSRMTSYPIILSQGVEASQATDDPDYATITLDGGSVLRDPAATARSLGGPIGVVVFFGALAVAFATKRRVETAVILAMLAPAAAALFVPPLATQIVRRTGEAWVLARIEFVFSVAYFCLVTPALVAHLQGYLRSRMLQSLFVAIACPAGAMWAGGEAPLTWKHWLARAAEPAAERQKHVRELRALRDFLAESLPARQTVVADPQMGMELVQAYNCHVVVSVSASNGVPDMARRFDDLHAMLIPETPWESRRGLFRKYAAEYLFPVGVPIQWTVGHVARHWMRRPYVLARLRIDS